MNERKSIRDFFAEGLGWIVLLSFLQLLIYILCHGRYGYFRDELYYIACSNHPAWGYVDQPPLSIFILKFSRWLLGDSLQAIRFFAALAGALVVFLAGWMARRLGGGRFAQILASLSVIAAPVLLGNGRYFSMNAFDVLFWTLACFSIIRILQGGDPRIWLIFGLLVGLGALNKYSIGFLGVGLVVGLMLTPQRKHFRNKWFWLGGSVALLLFLPHLLWEIRYRFPSLEWMHNVTQHKNTPITLFDFLWMQIREMNVFNASIWLLGLWYFIFHPEGKRFRPLAWMYGVILALMIASHAKPYYLSPIYPMLLAAGALTIERLSQRKHWSLVKPAVVSLVVLWGMVVAPFAVPFLPLETFIRYQRLLKAEPRTEERNTPPGVLPQHYADQVGWEAMTETVAEVYGRLLPEDRSRCGILVRNYGEAGAIDFFGKKHGLPRALCGHNSYWSWGPDDRSYRVFIIFGDSRDLGENLRDLGPHFESVELVAVTSCGLCMPYENGRQIFLCRGPKFKFKDIWPRERFYI